MKKHIVKFTLFLLTLPVLALAEPLPGIGGVAENLLEPVQIVANFLSAAAFIVGTSCLFAAFIRFFQYRKNPLANPLSTVIVLFLSGLVLILLPFIYKFTESGIPSWLTGS